MRAGRSQGWAQAPRFVPVLLIVPMVFRGERMSVTKEGPGAVVQAPSSVHRYGGFSLSRGAWQPAGGGARP
jgi:hypothetical protein